MGTEAVGDRSGQTRGASRGVHRRLHDHGSRREVADTTQREIKARVRDASGVRACAASLEMGGSAEVLAAMRGEAGRAARSVVPWQLP